MERMFFKHEPEDKIWWVRDDNLQLRFSFDKKKIFNLYRDYPQKLTKEQKELFDKENPLLQELFDE